MAKQETGKGSWWAGQRSGDELTVKGNIPQLKRFFINFGNRKRNECSNNSRIESLLKAMCSKYVSSNSLWHYVWTQFYSAASLKRFGRLHLYWLTYTSIRGEKIGNNPLTLHLSQRRFKILGLPSKRHEVHPSKIRVSFLPWGQIKQKIGTLWWF